MPRRPVSNATAHQLPILLENGSRYDWSSASYDPDVSVSANRATVQHQMDGASALRRLIEDGLAAWAVELRCPKTLMARVETSFADRQVVSWSSEEVDDVVWIVPGLIALTSLSLDGSSLTSLWADAGDLHVPAGWWLARGEAYRSKTLTESLVKLRRNKDLAKGTMEVHPDHSGGPLRFVVHMAPDVFKRARSDRTLQVAALVGVCGCFPREFGGPAESQSGSGTGDARDDHPVARELRDRLRRKSQDVALWDDPGNYDPALVATLLEPFDFGEEHDEED